MEINEKKLKAMLSEHKAQGGIMEGLLSKAIKNNISETALLNMAAAYYRHVGAIWVLSGILEGKEYDWKISNQQEESTEDDSGEVTGGDDDIRDDGVEH